MSKSKMFQPLEAPGELTLALYRRVSTDKQADEGYSLDVQMEKLRAYSKTFSDVREVRDYMDDGYSGSSLDRPGMERLVRDHPRDRGEAGPPEQKPEGHPAPD